MSPTAHAPKGFALAVILHSILTSLGLGWATWILIIPVAWLSHWVVDAVPHWEFIHFGTRRQFEEALAVDPKIRIKAIGLWPVTRRDGRDRLAADEHNGELADPKPLEIFKLAGLLGAADVLLAVIMALVIAVLWYRDLPIFGLIGLWGAGWAVMPDLLLFPPLYKRLIKYDWFWAIDYTHHWIHTVVVAYSERWVGALFELPAIAFFIWLCVHVHPLVAH